MPPHLVFGVHDVEQRLEELLLPEYVGKVVVEVGWRRS